MITSIFVLVFGLILIGFLLLPSEVMVQRQARIEAKPDDVFGLLISTDAFQQFNPYKDNDPDLQITPFGATNGVGAGFAFKGKEGKGTQIITHLEDNQSVTMQIDLGFMGKPVQTFTLTPDGAATRVSWAVKMPFGWNPMGRVFGLFADKVMGPTYERGLVNLNQLVTQ